MSVEDFFITPLTIVEPGSAETRGNDYVPDWDNPASVLDDFGWFAQESTVETIGGRDVVVTRDRVFLRVDTPISDAARVIGNGAVYEVDGRPNRPPTPQFGEHHVEVTLRFVEEVAS